MKDFKKHNTANVYSKKPRKKVSTAKKLENDKEYLRSWLMWVYGETRFSQWATYRSEESVESLEDLYELAGGGLPEEWFHKVTNRFNLNLKHKPGEPKKHIENYNLLYKNVNKLIGEKINRPFNYQVENKSPELGTDELEQKNAMIYMHLAEIFNEVKDLPPEEAQQILKERQEELDKREKEFKLNYKDAIAFIGQNILDHIKEDDKVLNKIKECWRHWVTVGEVYIQVQNKDNKVVSTPLSPLQVDYSRKSRDYNGKSVQNAEWVSVKYLWSVDEILDNLGIYLIEKDLDCLDEYSWSQLGFFNNIKYEDYTRGLDRYNIEEKIEVLFVKFSVFKKFGIVNYINPITFEKEQDIVDDNFKLTKAMKDMGWTIDWDWETEYWQGWIINGNITCGIQRSGCDEKGSGFIIGRRYNDLHTIPRSIVKLGLPYQKMWLVLWNKLEKAVAKSLGQGVSIPIQAVTGEEGNSDWNFDTFLKTMQETNIALYNAANPALRNQLAHNMFGKIDITAANEVQFYLNLIDRVEIAWDNFIGFTPARTGRQAASQAVGSVQAELVQSTDITEFLYNEFEEFEQEYLTALLELSKFAYYNEDFKSRRIYVRDKFHTEYIDVDVKEHMLADYGVFLVNSSKETKELQFMKDIGLQRASQGAHSLESFELVTANNTAALKKVLNDLYNKEQEKIEQEQLSQQEHEQKMKEMEKERLQLEADMRIYTENSINDNKAVHQKEIELIRAGANQLSYQNTMDSDSDGTPDVIELQQNVLEATRLQEDIKSKRIDQKLKNKELDLKKQIENKKAEVALKNKVVGEK